MANFHIDLIDFIEERQFFLLKFFTFEMEGMKRVIFLDN